MAHSAYHPNCCRTVLMDVQPMFYPIGNTQAASIYHNPLGNENMRVCTSQLSSLLMMPLILTLDLER